MSILQRFSITACAATLFLATTGAIFAGEVAGPPGSQDPKPTAAPTHAPHLLVMAGTAPTSSALGPTSLPSPAAPPASAAPSTAEAPPFVAPPPPSLSVLSPLQT